MLVTLSRILAANPELSILDQNLQFLVMRVKFSRMSEVNQLNMRVRFLMMIQILLGGIIHPDPGTLTHAIVIGVMPITIRIPAIATQADRLNTHEGESQIPGHFLMSIIDIAPTAMRTFRLIPLRELKSVGVGERVIVHRGRTTMVTTMTFLAIACTGAGKRSGPSAE
jgi:hypothetical protein